MDYRNGRKGKDGQWYFYEDELTRANAKWEKENVDRQIKASEQHSQETQNTIKSQMEAQERIAEKHIEAIETATQEQKNLENERQQHEENMRILKLFDDIGINKDIFDNFMNNVMVNLSDNEYDENKNMIPNKSLKSEKEYKKIEKLYVELEEVVKQISFQNITDDLLVTYEQLKADIKKNNASYSSFREYNEKLAETGNIYMARNALYDSDKILMEKITKHQKLFKPLNKVLIVLCIIMFFMFMKSNGNAMIWLILIPVTIFGAKKFKKMQQGKIIAEIDEELESAKRVMNKQEKETTTTKTQEEILNELTEIQKTIRKRKWAEFEKFRLEHYNSKIEKLLLDYELPSIFKEIGLDFKTITSKQAKNTGEIDDYILYFQEQLEK